MLVEAWEREAGLLDMMVGYRRTRLVMMKAVWWVHSITDFEEAGGEQEQEYRNTTSNRTATGAGIDCGGAVMEATRWGG